MNQQPHLLQIEYDAEPAERDTCECLRRAQPTVASGVLAAGVPPAPPTPRPAYVRRGKRGQ